MYNNIIFSTVSKEMLYFFKIFANNTFGKKVNYKVGQRYNDLNHLKKLVSKDEIRGITNECRLFVLKIPVKIPGILLKEPSGETVV